MSSTRLLALVLMTIGGSRALCAPSPSVADLAWMEGAWRGEDSGVAMEEIWTAPAGGIMLGMHRDVTAKRTSFEFIRIAQTPDGVVYFASPGGRPPTPFRLIESSARRAVFANPEHDFPKRILYWRDGDRLCARVEGSAESEAEEWCWERVRWEESE